MTEDVLLELLSSGDECVNNCDIINSTTCQLLTSVTSSVTSDRLIVDEHGCYDVAPLLPSSGTNKNLVNVSQSYEMSLF